MDRKRGAFPLYRRVVKDKTQNFQNAEAKRYTNQKQETFKLPFESNAVVYETFYTGYPVFLNMNYTIKIRTDYIQQLNDYLLFLYFHPLYNYKHEHMPMILVFDSV